VSYILDTTVLIDWALGRHGIDDVMRGIFAETDQVFTCDIVACEALSGGSDVERTIIRRLLRTLEYVAIDPEGAEHAGELRRTSGRTSARTLGDALIAALARRLDAAIVTRNSVDFAPFDVRLVAYGGSAAS